MSNILFESLTPLGFSVRVTNDYWNLIVTIKHPVMKGYENDVQGVLQMPDEVRRSKSDKDVYLFYKQKDKNRWICAVAKCLDQAGFLITAYLTDSIKEGERIWSK